MDIDQLRTALCDRLDRMGVPFSRLESGAEKPSGFESLWFRYEDRDVELAFGRDGQGVRAALVLLDPTGQRVGKVREVGPSTLQDLLDAMTIPAEEMSLRVEGALRGWKVERTRQGLRVERPSPAGPSAPDVVFVREGRAYTPGGLLLCCDVRASTMKRAWDRLAYHVGVATRAFDEVELSPADVARAGVDPGPHACFRLSLSRSGPELWAASGDGGWTLHHATALWPDRVREVLAAHVKSAL